MSPGAAEGDVVERTVKAQQNVSSMCFVCGRDNPASLKARFLELESGELLGIFEPDPVHQGYPGRLHGGVLSAMLDETIGRAISITDPGAWGVTVELTVRYRRPVPTGDEVRVLARIERDDGRLFEGSGEIRLPDGSLAVEARGRFLRLPVERIVEGDFSAQWFPDDRPAPDRVDV